MFSVCVAAAVGTSTGSNVKTNLLFRFAEPPSAAQVLNRSITAFSQLQQERGNFNEFYINCAMIFDDGSSRWVPLERSNQVVHNCQIYLFQPDVEDVAGPIPDPIPADSFLETYVTPQRNSASRVPLGGGSGATPQRSPRGMMPRDPDLAAFQTRPEPPLFNSQQYQQQQRQQNGSSSSSYYRSNDANTSVNAFYASQQQQQRHNTSSSNATSSRGFDYNNGGGADGDALTPRQREILRREAQRYDGGSVFVSGDSILKEERDKEERKISLPVDSHRSYVRDETRRFPDEISPERYRHSNKNSTTTSQSPARD